MSSESTALAVARAYHRAWNNEQFERASNCLADRVKVEVPINSYPTKVSFMQAVRRTREMTSQVRVLAEFGNEGDALLLYDMSLPFGELRVAEHFTVAGGHITRIRQIHDTAAIRAAGAGELLEVDDPKRKQQSELEGLARTVDLNAPPDRVYNVLTTLDGLRGWWTTLASGTATAKGRIHFEFEGLEETIDMRVEVADRPSHVRWQCLAHTKLPDWNGTTLDFALAPRAAHGCRLSFRHLGLTPELECYESCQAGWSHFLKSLAAYAETGEGSPFAGCTDETARRGRMKGLGRRKAGGGPKRAKAAGKAGVVAVPAILQPVIAALSQNPEISVEKGWGSSNVVVKVRGKLFVLLQQDRLVVKLPKYRVDDLVEASVGTRFDPRRDGRAMKEWVVLPQDGNRWTEVAIESYRFVSGATQ